MSVGGLSVGGVTPVRAILPNVQKPEFMIRPTKRCIRVESFLFQCKIFRHFPKIATQFHNEATFSQSAIGKAAMTAVQPQNSAALMEGIPSNDDKFHKFKCIVLGGQVPTVQSIRNRSTPSPPKLIQESNLSEGFTIYQIARWEQDIFFATQWMSAKEKNMKMTMKKQIEQIAKVHKYKMIKNLKNIHSFVAALPPQSYLEKGFDVKMNEHTNMFHLSSPDAVQKRGSSVWISNISDI